MPQRTVWLLVIRTVGAFLSFLLFLCGSFQIATSVLIDWAAPITGSDSPEGLLTIFIKVGTWRLHFYLGCLMVSLALTYFWVNRRKD